MPDSIGYSFAPGSDAGNTSGINRRPDAQEALQILSLVLPRIAAPNQMAPQSLLNSPGAAGGADPGIALLQKILGQIGQPGGPGGASVAPGAAGGSASSAGQPGAPSPFAQPNVPATAAPAQPSGPPRIVPGSTGGGQLLPTPTAPTAPSNTQTPWQVPEMPRSIFPEPAGGSRYQNPF